MFRNGLEPWHIVVIVALFVALFGYKKLPDAARSVGKSLRIFKTEMKGMVGDDEARDSDHNAEPAAPEQPQMNTSPDGTGPAVAPPPAATPAVAPQAPAPPPAQRANPSGE